MEALGQYVISVTTASLICAVVLSLSSGVSKGVIRVLCGIFLTFAVLRPVVNVDLEQWLNRMVIAEEVTGDSVAAFGEEAARNSITQRIRDDTAAYILDKATQLGASLKVDVVLSEEAPYLPQRVTLWGTVSPYVRQQLEEILAKDLGIAKENQQWTG